MDTAERLLRETIEARTPGTKIYKYLSSIESKESAAGQVIDGLNQTTPTVPGSEPAPPAPTVQSELPEEAKININGQWFYRGNHSPRWLACASRSDGSMSGISDDVETFVWPILEEIVRLHSLLAQREERIKELESERDAMQRRAESAEADWQAAEHRLAESEHESIEHYSKPSNTGALKP